MPPPFKPPLIICFGDSLTAGYQSPTFEHPQLVETPYGGWLQEWLGGQAEVAVSGISGELTGEMVMRFRQDVLSHKPSCVIILGGTNDLGWNAQPQDIMRNLLKMYEQALAAGISVVPVTVPSLRAQEAPDGGAEEGWIRNHINLRLGLNRLITEYAVRKQIPCADLFTATAEQETLLLALPYSNDGLHLTTDGYRRFAHLLYTEILAPRFGITGSAAAQDPA